MSAHELEIAYLRREVARAKGLLLVVLVLLLGIPLLSAQGERAPGILRARGLVIEDENGRERILIGAPVPHSTSRVREDFSKAKEAWGKRYPDPEMKWYAELDHGANGILILDANGHDRIAIGDPVPELAFSKRIAPATGIAINDAEGMERGGWGYFAALNRVGLGLDHPGGEGVNLFVLEDGSAGLFARSPDEARAVFLGHAAKDSFLSGLPAPLDGLLVRDAGDPRLVAGSAGGEPAVEIRDGQGEVVSRLPE